MGKGMGVVPAVGWMKSYRPEWLRADVVAGLTASAVVVPKAMAYAAIAGLPLVVGLYTAMVMQAVYVVLGTSAVLSVTTTSTIAVLTAGALAGAAPGGDPAALLAAAATLSLLVGAFLAAAGLLRLGAVANLISEPVLVGFKAGIGLVIVLDQVPKLLGIHIAKADFFRDLLSIVRHLPETSTPTLLLALAMLAMMVAIERFLPRLPAPLVTVGAGIAASAFAGLPQKGISVVGAVQAGLPPLVLPDLSLAEGLWPAALGIALMSFVETAAAGRAFLPKGAPVPAANRELVATGAGNAVGALFQVMPGGGGTSQTAVNLGAGARSQLAGVVTAAVVVATLFFLAPLVGQMPHATLAAVVVMTSVGLVKPSAFRAIRKVRAMEFRWALVAAAGVLLLGTLKGILAAVLVSLVALIVRANQHPLLVLGRKPGTNVFRPLSPEHPGDEAVPGLLMLRPTGTIYFANAPRLAQQVRDAVGRSAPKVVALDLSAVPEMEYTALGALAEGEERSRESGVELWLVAMNPEVLAVVERSPLGERLGHAKMFFTLEQAVERFRELHGGTAAPGRG